VAGKTTVLGNACRKTQRFAHQGDGQALVEFAFAFPLQLLIMFAIMQLALLYVAKQVVSYASYSAARSAMVADTVADAQRRARDAAALVCAPITGPTVEGSNFNYAYLQSGSALTAVPGWGYVPKSGISRLLKTYVSQPAFSENGEVTVTVTHYYELVFPVVGRAFAWLAGSGSAEAAGARIPDATGPGGTSATGSERTFEESVGIWQVSAPHVRLRETTTLAIPGSEAEIMRRRGLF